MKCPKCGGEIPANSKYCLSCGNPVQMSAGAALELMRANKARKRTINILAILSVVIIIAIIVLLVILGRGKVLEAPPVQPPPPPPAAYKPPQEIVDYVNHVKEIEKRRNVMKNDMGPALEMFKAATGMRYETDEDSYEQKEDTVKTGLEEYTKKWQDIVNSFNSKTAPPGCERLGNAYSIALGKYSSAMIGIQEAFYKQDLGALTAMQGSVQQEMDDALVQADQELAGVCTEYKITKDFSILPDKDIDSLLMPR